MFFQKTKIEIAQPLINAFDQYQNTLGISNQQLAASVQELWPTLAKNRGVGSAAGPGSKSLHYSFEKKLVNAYALYYLPVNFLKIKIILEEMKLLQLADASQLNSWLDIGCGPGTALWGIDSWFQEQDQKFSYIGVDQSKRFLESATALAGYFPNSKATAREFVAAEIKSNLNEIVGLVRKHKSKVVSFMNSLSELAPQLEPRKKVLLKIIETLAEESRRDQQPRWLILIEPGSKLASRELIELRTLLLNDSLVQNWLPCLNHRRCGALDLADDWCHEEVKCDFTESVQEVSSLAGLKKENLLFSYLVFSVGVHPKPAKPWPSEAYRVVSQRLEEKGLTRCFFCSPNQGKIKARVVLSQTNQQNQLFHELVRGDLLTAITLDEKNSVIACQKLRLDRPS